MLINFFNEINDYPPAYVFDTTSGINNAIVKEWEVTDPAYVNNSKIRNLGARFFLPTEDEWYKAAYFDSTLGCFNNGGYWFYATQQEYGDPPINPDPEDLSLSGRAVLSTTVRDVSAAGSESYFGTIGQDGNAPEQMFSLVDEMYIAERSVSESVGTGLPGKNQSNTTYSKVTTRTATASTSTKGARIVDLVMTPGQGMDEAGAEALASLSGTIGDIAGSFQAVANEMQKIEDVSSFIETLSSCNSAYMTVCALSANWNSTHSAMTGLSARWDSTFMTVSELSACWTEACDESTVVQTYSADWNQAYTSSITLSAEVNNINASSITLSAEVDNINDELDNINNELDGVVKTKNGTTQEVSHIVQMPLTYYLELSTLPPSHSDHGPKEGWLYIINDL